MFAYKCENNNSCPFKVMNGKITDVNFNSHHRCGPKKTGKTQKIAPKKRSFLILDEKMGESDSSGECRSEEVLALRIKFPTKIPVSADSSPPVRVTQVFVADYNKKVCERDAFAPSGQMQVSGASGDHSLAVPNHNQVRHPLKSLKPSQVVLQKQASIGAHPRIVFTSQ